jgi:hypothetical protein
MAVTVRLGRSLRFFLVLPSLDKGCDSEEEPLAVAALASAIGALFGLPGEGTEMSMRSRVSALALVGAVTAGCLLTFSNPALANTSAPAKPVTCSAIAGSDNPGHKLTTSGCTGATGGSGSVAAPFFSPSTIHWAGGGKTTVTFNPTPRRTGVCPGGSKGFKILGGKVKSSTVTGISGPFEATFCFSPAGRISLLPKTRMTF